jgi:uncharacterized protein YndB with AHSA1/START domain
MALVHETIHIKAPLDRVFEFVVDYKQFPRWQTNLLEVKDVTGVPGTVGFTYKGFFKALDRRMEGTFKITKVERPRFIEEFGTIVGGGKMLTTTTFETTPESGTLVTFKVEYILGVDIPETERIVLEHSLERGLRYATETLKELIEVRVPVPA